jgi:DNA-directed RNA polymerase subunit RPC12/RpoP
MMVIAFWHGWARRTSWGKLFVWLVVVGAFNLAGLLAYLALNHTAVIKCPVCGRRRGLERVDCVRCGAELPVPERRKLDLILDT